MNRTVYVVDDDPLALDLICSSFQVSGYRVEGFVDAIAFLAAAPNLPHGCIVLDLEMPALSGLEVQQALLAMNVRHPIVFNSGRCSVPDAVKGMQAGACDFLQKSTYMQPLLDAVEDALRPARAA